MTPDEIVTEITRRAWKFGVSVLLAPSDRVDMDGLKVSGYFDGNPKMPQLVVARDAPRWLGTLLHEYSHLTQWAEGAPVWFNDCGDWSEWLNGKPLRNVKRKIAFSREIEADCERRAVRLMRELDAPIDIEQYIRGANAYVHFYNVIAETRKWYAPDRRPYNMPKVLAAANSTLDRDYSKTPKELRARLLECVGD
jgi:hypothetical protein